MEDLEDVFSDEAVYDPDDVDTNQQHEGEVMWCLHCERCYPYGWYRKQGDLHMCPYHGCDGDVVMDAWPWKKLVQVNGYPEEPEYGKTYSKFG